MNEPERSWSRRLLAGAVSVWLAALALYCAAQLVQAVWLTLVLISAASLVVGGVISWLWRQKSGW